MIKRFYLLFFLSALLFSCAEENSNLKYNPSSNSIEFYNAIFQFGSKIGESKYLIKVPRNSQSSKVPRNSQSSSVLTNSALNVLSDDSQSGFVYALNSSDEVINLFNPFESGELKDISKKGDSNIMVGEFTKGNTTCLVLLNKSAYSTCLVAKQKLISSIGATFIKDESQVALLIENSGSGKKELYFYNTTDGFLNLESSGSVQPLQFDLTGPIVDSYSSNDYAAFYTKNGDEGEILFVKNEGFVETKKESVTSEDVQDVGGEPLFMSNGNLRQGWSNSVYYNLLENNRTISDSGLLVSHKDAFFQIYYQSNYTTLNKNQEIAYNNPMLFYLKPKRKGLPAYYPSFTLEPIHCCKSLNNPSGTRDLVNQLSWKKAAGFKKYVLAYGEIVGADYYAYESDTSKVINILKAIILINADSKDIYADGNYQMPAISLYDYNDTSSEEDNLIKPLSYDTVSSIETYKNGFKITGTKNNEKRIVYFNPLTKSIETPLTSDQQVFLIKERI